MQILGRFDRKRGERGEKWADFVCNDNLLMVRELCRG